MAEKQIQVPAAVAQQLAKSGAIVFTRYELVKMAWHIYRQSTFDGVVIRKQRDQLDHATFNRVESQLVQNGVLRPISGLPDGAAYTLVGANVTDPRILACGVDPFCYISHLSAMEFHGLTDRLPENIYISSPASTQWRGFSEIRIKRDFGDDYEVFRKVGLPSLQRPTFEKLGGRTVYQFRSIHLGAFQHMKEQHIRIATIGRTFLDMLRDPSLCGGIQHVLDIYKNTAVDYFVLIADELDQHGGAIDKVRAGFVLEDVCGLSNPRIDAWVKYKQRGGSRKLDASAEYNAKFSPRWDLSINTTLP